MTSDRGLTLKDIKEAFVLLSELVKLSLKASVAYDVAKVFKAVQSEALEVKSIEDKVVKQFGEVIEGTNQYTIPKEKLGEFNQEIEALYAKGSQIVIPKILLKDLVTSEGKEIDVAPVLLAGLDFFIHKD